MTRLWEEVEAFSKLYFSTRNDQAFQAHLKQAHERYVDLLKEEQELFRRDAGTFGPGKMTRDGARFTSTGCSSRDTTRSDCVRSPRRS